MHLIDGLGCVHFASDVVGGWGWLPLIRLPYLHLHPCMQRRPFLVALCFVSPVVHACRDPRLPVLFSGLLSEPCLAAVLVINVLRHRSPLTHKKFGRFIYSDLMLEPWWTVAGPLTALPL